LIEQLIRQVMTAKSLSQQDLADLTGASLSRVKAITSGRVAKLKPDEIRALVEELHVSADWLATGAGPMFRPLPQAEDQDAFTRRMQMINAMGGVIDALPLQDLERARLKVLLTGDTAMDGALVAQALAGGLKPDEAALLDNYRNCPQEGKQQLERSSALYAQLKKKRA
jgi:transcriptional regulator with XRE-family HTH domain